MKKLVCPWCHTPSITPVQLSGKIRLQCPDCGMDAYVIKPPETLSNPDADQVKAY